MSVSPEALTASILLFGVASGVYSSPFLHLEDAKHGCCDRVRWGEVAGTMAVVGVGALMASIHNSPIPFAASIAIATFFVAGFEYRMSHPPITGG